MRFVITQDDKCHNCWGACHKSDLEWSFVAWINTTKSECELIINFLNRKPNSGDRLPASLKYQFADYDKAGAFLFDYLRENKPREKFVCFSNESQIEGFNLFYYQIILDVQGAYALLHVRSFGYYCK